jgi:hypothetical protein
MDSSPPSTDLLAAALSSPSVAQDSEEAYSNFVVTSSTSASLPVTEYILPCSLRAEWLSREHPEHQRSRFVLLGHILELIE